MNSTGEPQQHPAQPPAQPPMYQGWQPPAGPPPGPPAGPPMMPWMPPPQQPPKKGLSGGLIAVIVVAGVIVLGCLGTIGVGAIRAAQHANSAQRQHLGNEDAVPNAGTRGGDPSEPSAEDGRAAGPRASTYPVREDDDLARVCDGWYYPQSPKYTGKAPHPISVGTVDRKDSTSRYMSSYISIPYELGPTVQKAWAPDKPARSQLMACVDLVATGTKVVKNCKFDDPKPAKLPMKTATYHLRLYEVATGHKLVDKRVAGEDEDCPTIVFLGADKTVYSTVGDRQLYELLRNYVMKK